MTTDPTLPADASTLDVTHRRSLGAPGVVLICGLVTGGLSLVALKAFGMEMPAVPPALVLMILAAVLVAVVRRRWTAAVAILLGLAEAAALVAGGLERLDDGNTGIAAATAVRAVAVGVIVVAGIVVLARRPRGSR